MPSLVKAVPPSTLFSRAIVITAHGFHISSEIVKRQAQIAVTFYTSMKDPRAVISTGSGRYGEFARKRIISIAFGARAIPYCLYSFASFGSYRARESLSRREES